MLLNFLISYGSFGVIDTVTWEFSFCFQKCDRSSDTDLCVACCPNIAFEHIITCDLWLPPSGAYEVSGGVMVSSHCHSWWRWCCDTSLRDTLIMTAVLSSSFWFCWSEHSSYLQSDTLEFSVQYHWLVNYVDILNLGVYIYYCALQTFLACSSVPFKDKI